jgi:hypothetical protein
VSGIPINTTIDLFKDTTELNSRKKVFLIILGGGGATFTGAFMITATQKPKRSVEVGYPQLKM